MKKTLFGLIRYLYILLSSAFFYGGCYVLYKIFTDENYYNNEFMINAGAIIGAIGIGILLLKKVLIHYGIIKETSSLLNNVDEMTGDSYEDAKLEIRAFVELGIVVYLAIMFLWFAEGSLFDFTNTIMDRFGVYPNQIPVLGELLCVLGVIQFFGILFTLLCALCAWIYYVGLRRNKA